MQSIKTKAIFGTRLFLGVVFTVFGLNGFFQFLPSPEVSAEAGAFLGALGASGYMFPLIKGTEVIAGVLLLSGRYVPLALTLLAPITVNIALFHAFLAPGLTLPMLIVAAQLWLAYAHRDAFSPMLKARTQIRIESSSRQVLTTDAVGAH